MTSAESAYPADPWRIREIRFDPALLVRNETIFALANGSLGIRGSFEEGRPAGVPGTYINGFYEQAPIAYGEVAFGYARNRQVMLNVANGTGIAAVVDGDAVDLSTGTILSYERCLDLRTGLLSRAVRWLSPGGVEVLVESRRLVSFARPSIAAIEWRISFPSRGAALQVDSVLQGDVSNQSSSSDPRIGAHFIEPPLVTTGCRAAGTSMRLTQETRSTRKVLACAAGHVIDAGTTPVRISSSCSPLRAGVQVRADMGPGFTLLVTKVLAYRAVPGKGPGELVDEAQGALEAALGVGFDVLADEQGRALADFWQTSDIQIDGDDGLQQGLRYNLFSLFQSAGRDGRTSIAAKGLTGQGYEGHYFWDTEIYVLPFFAYTQPAMARALVRYRCSIIDAARERAVEMSQRGALFPWRTIGGEETSAYYPAGTAQYHIDADIVHALRVYREATGDATILADGGAELVFETARMWRSLGEFSARRGGAFCINEVTGPNEYTALVNNNLYTNMMARENLQYAAAVAAELRAATPAVYERVAAAIHLEDAEIAGWEEAAARMYIPMDRGLGVHAQDDSFLDKEPWDFAGTPKESYPLLLHYHPLVIYRHQVLKQPDVVLAQVLLGHSFTMAEKRRNFLYYDPLTTGDSSLSPCIQSVAAAEIGLTDLAREYFSRTARMDLDDVNGNVGDGVHTAAMAGTWISLVHGFAGMRDHDGVLSFDPRLPAGWRGFRFRLAVRGRLLEVALTRDSVTYGLLSGPGMEIVHRRRAVRLESGAPVTIDRAPRLLCVIFDLDGVLTDTAELHYQAWKQLCSEMRIPFDRAVNEELRGIGRRESFDIILRHAGISLSETERSACAERKNGMYRELISRVTPDDLLPGIPALLAALRKAGIRIGLASASHNAPEIVRRLAIDTLIDAVADPGRVVKGKPDPELFFSVADALSVPYDCCVGVEDAVAGIEAIRAAGMFSVGIGERITTADWCLPDTGSLSYDELARRFREAGRT